MDGVGAQRGARREATIALTDTSSLHPTQEHWKYGGHKKACPAYVLGLGRMGAFSRVLAIWGPFWAIENSFIFIFSFFSFFHNFFNFSDFGDVHLA